MIARDGRTKLEAESYVMRSAMTRRQRISAVTLVALTMIVAGVAHAGTIPPVGGVGTATLSVFQRQGTAFVDVTDTYLPTWTPTATPEQRTVYIVVNGSTAVPGLVGPTATTPTTNNRNPYLAERTTSAFRGNCTNHGDATTADFEFNTLPTASIRVGNVQMTGYSWTANDCGGMAVLSVGNDKFIVPRDADSAGQPTGVPDALDVFGVVLAPESDPDGD